MNMIDLQIKSCLNNPLSSPIRSFLQTIKSCGKIHPSLRVFMTGITPITLADASGINFIKDISLDAKFGDILGFSQIDIARGLKLAGIEE